MSEEGGERGFAATGSYPPHEQQPLVYGTFQGVANYPPQPAVGYPHPVLGASAPPPPEYYAHGYQTVPGYAIAEGRPVRERPLPFYIGMGWFLFIVGFFLAGIPWYVGAFFLLCSRTIDYREKPGYVSCTIAALLTTIAVIFVTISHAWDWDWDWD